jgi:DNA end-binding protein Ku
MDHASWKGFIRLSLVSIPVQAYSASAPAREQLPLHQLHQPCHNPIRYKKTCPIHGEVPNEEIVKGFEYSKDQYVIVESAELKRFQTRGEQVVNIHGFVRPDELDAIYYAGKTYYLLPEGAAGEKPYALLRDAMAEKDVLAIAQMILGGRQELMVLRPKDELLTLSALDYASQLREPPERPGRAREEEHNKRELDLTKSLIEATTIEPLDMRQFQDVQKDELRAMIDAKVAGKEIVAAPSEEVPQVINLMDALRASLSQAGRHETAAKSGRRGGKSRPPPPRHRGAARRKRSKGA